jgi:putative oxidoreductase
MRHVALLLFSGIFVTGGWQQVQEPHPRAERARNTGLAIPDELVRASGWAMIAGSVALHIKPLRRLTALLLALQLIPITYVGHRYWELEGPARFQNRTHFFKNVSIIGGALFIALTQED